MICALKIVGADIVAVWVLFTVNTLLLTMIGRMHTLMSSVQGVLHCFIMNDFLITTAAAIESSVLTFQVIRGFARWA